MPVAPTDLVMPGAAWLSAELLPLLQAAARTLPDTIVTKQVVTEPGWLQRASEALRALMTLAIVVLTFAVVPAAWNFRKSYQKVSDLLDRVYADVNPLTHHASRIAENVDYVSGAIRADIQRVSATVSDAERRLQRAIARAEARARELEALLDVARAEAEDTFVSAASAVHGMRAGVAALRDDLADASTPARRRGTDAAADEASDAPGAPAARPLPGEPLASELALALDDAWDEVEDDPDTLHESDVAPRVRPRVRDVRPAAADEDRWLAYQDPEQEDDPHAARERVRDEPERPRVRPRRGPQRG
jgi:hypothetical protein